LVVIKERDTGSGGCVNGSGLDSFVMFISITEGQDIQRWIIDKARKFYNVDAISVLFNLA